MKKEWIAKTERFSTGEFYRVGKVVVANYFHASVSHREPAKYRCMIELPGIRIKPEFMDHATVEGAKAQIERSVETWFKWANEE